METAAKKKLRCIVVGAGVSGILIAIKLREALQDRVDFWIFEKNEDIGGTWLENRYPGCACDVPSHIYQYSFIPNPSWSNFYASSAEIKAYIKAVAFHYDVQRFITFNSSVTQATWNETDSKWTVTLQNGSSYECEILINASGILNNLKYPRIKNLDSFQGPVLHTAAWDDKTHLRGKRIALIGAGASAIQTLPAIQKHVEHVDVYIRTPSWITPPILETMASSKNFEYSLEDQDRFRHDPEYSIQVRKEMESSSNKVLKAIIKGSIEQTELREKLETSMKRLITDTKLQEQLIPKFEVGCRRLSPGETYLQALQENNVSPAFGEIEDVAPEGLVAGGELRPADIIILATGFDTSFRPRFPILGQGGVDLRELWKDDPVSYCGLAVSGFPNYLIFLGPNTPISNGSLMGTLEVTADYFVRIIEKVVREDVLCFNIRPEVQSDFDKHTQEMMKNMVWSGDCKSWFKNERGKVTALWPGSSLHYREFLNSSRWEDFEWLHKGNRFTHWGQGFAKVESEPDGDLAYYLKTHEPLPLEAYYHMAKGFAGSTDIPEHFQAHPIDK